MHIVHSVLYHRLCGGGEFEVLRCLRQSCSGCPRPDTGGTALELPRSRLKLVTKDAQRG